MDLHALKCASSALSPSELEELYHHLLALRAFGGSKTTTPKCSTAEDWAEQALYGALAEVIARSLGRHSVMPLSHFRTTTHYISFHKAVVAALAIHRDWLPDLDRAHDTSMFRLYSELIVEHLRSTEHPAGVSWRGMAWGLEHLPQIVDQQFPSYAQSGLLKLVANLRTTKPPMRPLVRRSAA